jgi:hypothetical protein
VINFKAFLLNSLKVYQATKWCRTLKEKNPSMKGNNFSGNEEIQGF